MEENSSASEDSKKSSTEPSAVETIKNALEDPTKPIDKTKLRPNHFCDRNAQQKYRKNSRSKEKDSKDVAHKLARSTFVAALQKIPDEITGAQKKTLKREINDHWNFHMKNADSNRSADKMKENKINRQIKGEKVERVTGADRQKLDIGLKFARYMAENSDQTTREIWKHVVELLERVQAEWAREK